MRKTEFLKGKLLQNKDQEPRALNTYAEWEPSSSLELSPSGANQGSFAIYYL